MYPLLVQPTEGVWRKERLGEMVWWVREDADATGASIANLAARNR